MRGDARHVADETRPHDTRRLADYTPKRIGERDRVADTLACPV
jgi:hypothetical protein